MELIDGAYLWHLKATHGLPLDMAIMKCAQHDRIPTWLDLLRAARRDGANIDVLIRELQFCVREAYPQPVADEVNHKLGWFEG